MHHLRDLTVLILGLGDSGLAMARWCARCGASVRVTDTRSAPPHAVTLAHEVPQALLHQGLDVNLLDGVNLVLKSPGLAPNAPDLAALLAEADAQGIPVRGELSLFASALTDLKADLGYTPKVVAITGTNGKTTTTSLTAQLIERAGWRVAVAGNIGPTLLDTLCTALDAEPPQPPADIEAAPVAPAFEVLPQAWVLELSSFQLDGVSNFEPDAAVVLNISQDHLDWHGSMAAYAEAKSRIYGRHHTTMVINRDDPTVEAMVPPPEVIKSGVRGQPARVVHRRVVRFGLDTPRLPGDFGLVTEAGMAWLVRAQEADPTIKLAKGESHELVVQRLMPADALRIRGRHNASNALAALALATAIGCGLAPMLHGLREYRGEPHRVEMVASVGGVDAIDDSKGTNVGATVAALTGLGADLSPGKLVVILGGDGKGQDFSPLSEPLSRHARAIALIGRDAPALAAVLQGLRRPGAEPIEISDHDSLEAATRWCFAQAQPGDAVLLSPACASLDMFRNYAHRAEVFVQTVHDIAHDRGGVA